LQSSGGTESAAADAQRRVNRRISTAPKTDDDAEHGLGRHVSSREVDSINEDSSDQNSDFNKKLRHGQAAVVQGLNRPFFHMDLTSALQSAIQNISALEVKPSKFELETEKSE